MSRCALSPNFAGIPAKPQKSDVWLVWAEQVVDGRLTKVPYRAGDLSRHASTSDRSTWSPYTRAKSAYLGHKDTLAGVGWCRDGNVALIDGDNFFRQRVDDDEKLGYEFEKYGLAFNRWDWSGKQPEEIYHLLLSADAWIELSPSGFGLHAVLESSSIVASFDAHVPGADHTGLALYTGHRYVTVTGATLWAGNYDRDSFELVGSMHLWVPKPEEKRRAFAAGAGAQAQSRPMPQPPPPIAADMGDDAVLARLKKSRKGRILFDGGDPGDLSDNSHSGLDFALCIALAFWTRKDPGQMDRLFRQSALYREDKWERDAYRESTITRAIETQTEVWEPRVNTGRAAGGGAAHATAARKANKGERTRTQDAKEANPPKSPSTGGFSAEAHSPDRTPPQEAPDDTEGGSSGEPPPPPDDEGAPPVPDGSWKKLLKRGRGGVVLASHFNADLALRWSPEWIGADLVLDEFANVIRSRGAMPWGDVVESWTDADSVRAAIWMQQHDLPVTPGIMSDVVHAWADKHRVHPLREWLRGLKWDGKPRINSWLHTYLGALSNNYTAQSGAWWMGQCVARAFHPGAQADYTLVLEGPQGQKKSQALRTLAGDKWFTDQIADFSSKDSSMDLQGKWVIELGEFDRMAHKPSVVKAFLTRMEDRFRPPYGRHSLNFPRQCVFAATVNLEEYFADSTGNRRFWPVKCGEIDLEALAHDREQLWAEAVVRFENNRERRWPSTEMELSAFSAEQSQREETDIWQEEIIRWVAKPRTGYDASTQEPLGPMNSTSDVIIPADVVTHCIQIPLDKQTEQHKQRVSRTLRRLGFTPDMHGPKKKRYRVWLAPPPEEPKGQA